MPNLNEIFFVMSLTDIKSQQQIKKYIEDNDIINIRHSSHKGSMSCADFSQFNVDKINGNYVKSEDEYGNDKYVTNSDLTVIFSDYYILLEKNKSVFLMNSNDYSSNCTLTT